MVNNISMMLIETYHYTFPVRPVKSSIFTQTASYHIYT